jgi:transcriptional regulator with XRE-family HTH domain
MPKARLKTERPDPLDVHIGRRIRRRRIALKLVPEALASRVGLTAAALERYEAGAQSIAAADLWRVAKALRISMRHFVRGIPKPRPTKRAREADALERRVLKPLMALPPACRTEMVRYVGALARTLSADR